MIEHLVFVGIEHHHRVYGQPHDAVLLDASLLYS